LTQNYIVKTFFLCFSSTSREIRGFVLLGFPKEPFISYFLTSDFHMKILKGQGIFLLFDI